jgi:hypothetical protein
MGLRSLCRMSYHGVDGNRATIVADGEADEDRLGEPAQIGAQSRGSVNTFAPNFLFC